MRYPSYGLVNSTIFGNKSGHVNIKNYPSLFFMSSIDLLQSGEED